MLTITWEGVDSTNFSNMASWGATGQPAADVDVIFDIDATEANGKSPILSKTEDVATVSVNDNTTELHLNTFTLNTHDLTIANDDDATLDIAGPGTWNTAGNNVVVGHVDERTKQKRTGIIMKL